MVAGNHDSPARLDAPTPVLRALKLNVVGMLPRLSDGRIDTGRVVVPVKDREGRRAWILAVPFLRASDLPEAVSAAGLEQGVRAIYDQIIAHAQKLRGDDEPIIAMGHLYMIGGSVSDESERKILGGNQHALPIETITRDVAYAALGHLHLAQRIGGSDYVRYSGAPIPLSMAEASYPHQVCIVDLHGAAVREVRTLAVPRTVEFRRVPAKGAAPVAEVLRELASMPERSAVPEERHAFVEVVVTTGGPEPGLVSRIEEALQGKAAYLVKITRNALAGGAAPAPGRFSHREYTPEEVFVQRWVREYDKEPSAHYLQAFHELVDQVNQEGP